MLGAVWRKLKDFVLQDLWRASIRDLPFYKAFVLRLGRVTVVSLRGVWTDRLALRASALTFYSLMAMVPLLAVAFGVAKGFGLQDMLEQALVEKLGAYPEAMGRVVEMSRTLLEATRGGIIGGIGMLLLLWSAFRVLAHSEAALNDIWGVSKGRSVVRKLTDYIAILLFCPVLLFISVSITVAAGRYMMRLAQYSPLTWVLGPIAQVILSILPYCAAWVVFTFVYSTLTHTKVNLLSALAGGVLAGSLYQITQTVYIEFQIGVSRANAIYGSFAALPLLMVWLHISWFIFLFGAEVCFAHQNIDAFHMEQERDKISFSYRILLGLCICRLLAKRFKDGEPALAGETIASDLNMPAHLTNEVLENLVEAGLLSRSWAGDNEETATYQPATALDNFTVARVTERLLRCGGMDKPTRDSPEFERVYSSLQGFRKAIEEAPANKRLVDL